MTGRPYAVRLAPSAAKVLVELPEHAEDIVWDVLGCRGGLPVGRFRQWDAGDPWGEDVRIAPVGHLSVIYWINRPPRHLSVLGIVWLG